MQFTQFMFPDGCRKPVIIDMPDEIERLAADISASGYRFEIECFPDTQLVHMDCCNEDAPLWSEVVKNGPEVPVAVERLVRRSFDELAKLSADQAEADA
jgi:hypothetical protein